VIDCRDRSVQVTLDGEIVAVGNDLNNSAGYVGLRAEAGRVDIRDVILTPLNDDTRRLPGNRFEKGSRIASPKLVTEVKPQYTEAAMHERIQGGVWTEVEVLENGSVGDVLVVNSLDPVFGLDEEAVRAVKEWRFQPATQDGMPLRMVVTIELTFTLK
jgi:TonB family protein